tara:strand:- start:239 stop:598 length:360 start_codon:yes stop_codon:yes gene_type:complete
MGFVLDDTLVKNEIVRGAMTDNTLVVIEVERRPTAAESITAFMNSVSICGTPGTVVEGRPTPVRGGLVKMENVGAVIRDSDGRRVNTDQNVTLLCALNDADTIYACYGDVVGRVTTVRV